VTPGVSTLKLRKLRPFVGMLSIVSVETTVETSAAVVSTTGASTLTVIDSVAPGRIEKSRSTRCPICRRTPVREAGAKPESSAVTLYRPAESAGM
jgi:hypothetical protein